MGENGWWIAAALRHPTRCPPSDQSWLQRKASLSLPSSWGVWEAEKWLSVVRCRSPSASVHSARDGSRAACHRSMVTCRSRRTRQSRCSACGPMPNTAGSWRCSSRIFDQSHTDALTFAWATARFSMLALENSMMYLMTESYCDIWPASCELSSDF